MTAPALIDTTLHTVFKNLLEGALLVMLVLYLFLGHLRAAAIVAVIIPLALLATFIGLQLRNLPANLLSLGAMDFGIIVDGAVIVVENIFRHLSDLARRARARPRHAASSSTIIEAAAEVGRPTVFSMLIIIIAHLPIFTLQRQEGRIFAPMAYTIVSALIGSLLFSLTLVPLLAFFLLRSGVPHGENRRGAICQARSTGRCCCAPCGSRGWCWWARWRLSPEHWPWSPRLGSEFLPELNEGSVWVNLTLPPGISVPQAVKECARVRHILHHFPEVRSVISKAGRPEDGTDPKQVNMAEFLVDLYPQDQWKRKISKKDLLDEFQNALDAVPGYEPSFSQPIRDNILESISQIDGQIVIKVFGDDHRHAHGNSQARARYRENRARREPRVYRPRRPGAAAADRHRPRQRARATA